MKNREKIIAEYLLQIKAIKLEPAKPFLWASGWHSPIYCDNRLILSFPETRKFIVKSFCELIGSVYSDATLIAGVATGAIAHGAIVADRLDLPFAYVRNAPKGHGLANTIEGRVSSFDKVVVIEDLVSTGKSSLSAVEALRTEGCNVMGMAAIFSYGFETAADNFRMASCELHSLTNYEILIDVAIDKGFVSHEHIKTLRDWRNNPEEWGKL
jgi:orotate phosphoribosyltransferase